jgi:chemotaxis protein CheX
MSIGTGADNIEIGSGGRIMESKYIKPFVIGAKHVFKTMLDVDLADGPPFPKSTNQSIADVTGVMGFTGDRRGTMAFSMSTEGARAIYARLMGVDAGALSPEIVDAMGEFTNIISGQARMELEKEDIHLTAHLPMVFIGRNVQVSLATKGTIFTIPFSFSLNGKTEEMSLDCVFE